MKSIKRVISLLLVAFMLFGFASCGSSKVDSPFGELAKSDNSDIVMQLGDYYLTEREFYYIASHIKDSVIYYYQSYYYSTYGVVPSAEEMMKMSHPSDKDRMFADYVKECAIEVAQQLLVVEKLCADSGIKLTNADDINAIKNYIDELEYAYGGEDLFAIKLEELGYSKSGIVRVEQMYYLSDLLLEYRYGDNGVARIPEETVNKYFIDNYIRYDGASYNYVKTVEDANKLFQFTDDEIVAFFKENYVRVNHVLYMTVDSNNKELSAEAKAKKKAAAEAALGKINSEGEDKKKLEDFKGENEDSNFQYTFTYGQMVDAFEKAAFGEWNEGEVKLVETEYGYHLMEKVEMTDDEINKAVFGETTDDGKTKGGSKDTIVVNMANEKIKEIGLEEANKVADGEIEGYPEESTEKTYYELKPSSFILKDDKSYTSLVDMIKDSDYGEYAVKALDGGVYIVRKLEFAEKDITAEIYDKIESSYVNDAYWEYVQSHYDSMDIKNELINKIDFSKLPALEEEFYNATKS